MCPITFSLRLSRARSVVAQREHFCTKNAPRHLNRNPTPTPPLYSPFPALASYPQVPST